MSNNGRYDRHKINEEAKRVRRAYTRERHEKEKQKQQQREEGIIKENEKNTICFTYCWKLRRWCSRVQEDNIFITFNLWRRSIIVRKCLNCQCDT
jgi:uroporphyrinogen-III synthase